MNNPELRLTQQADRRMDDVEKAIVALLQAEVGKWNDDRSRTQAVQKAIIDVAQRHNWGTAANKCKDANEDKEFLYDVFCYQPGEESMTHVQLVAESEWGSEGHIIEDFDKLLVARSMYRVMVFRAGSRASVNALVEKMCKRIENFHGAPGDRYLFAGWVGEPESRFFFTPYVFGHKQATGFICADSTAAVGQSIRAGC